jgi:hypothetical protein
MIYAMAAEVRTSAHNFAAIAQDQKSDELERRSLRPKIVRAFLAGREQYRLEVAELNDLELGLRRGSPGHDVE